MSSAGRTWPTMKSRSGGGSTPPAGVPAGQLGGERFGDAAEVAQRLLGGDAGPEPGQAPPRRVGAGEPVGFGRGRHRQPDLGRAERILVVRRGHPDDHVRQSVEHQRAAEDRRGRCRSAQSTPRATSTATRWPEPTAVSASLNRRPRSARAPSSRSVLAVTKQPTSRSGRSPPVSSRSGSGRCRGLRASGCGRDTRSGRDR